jgi:hypothetical protein
MLNSLVERVNATQLSEKDPDAAALLQRGFGGNADSIYILAQSVLVQNIALEQARAQLADVKEQLAQAQQHPAKGTSFLGSLLGHKDPAPAPPPPQQQPQYQPAYTPQAQPEYQTPYNPGPAYAPPYQPGYQAGYQGQPYQAPYGGPQYVAAPPVGMGGPFAQGSFLRGAAQTAAGVAAGALAFEGVESLLHGGFGHPGFGMGMGGYGMGGGWGMPGMGMGYERPIEETVVNNYYDSPGGGEYREHDSGGYEGERHFHESSDDGNSNIQDASWNDNSGSGSDYDSSGDFGNNDSGGDSGGF